MCHSLHYEHEMNQVNLPTKSGVYSANPIQGAFPFPAALSESITIEVAAKIPTMISGIPKGGRSVPETGLHRRHRTCCFTAHCLPAARNAEARCAVLPVDVRLGMGTRYELKSSSGGNFETAGTFTSSPRAPTFSSPVDIVVRAACAFLEDIQARLRSVAHIKPIDKSQSSSFLNLVASSSAAPHTGTTSHLTHRILSCLSA